MPRITKVYTRTGDDGTTGLGAGRRVSKASRRVEAYGTVDELNSAIGVALAGGCGREVERSLRRVQNELFHLGADLCVLEEEKAMRPGPEIRDDHVAALEADIDALSEELPPLENFVLPGGCRQAAELHLARTVCRRAERRAVELAAEEAVGDDVIRYLNRLSDLLFCAARAENARRGVTDVLWNSRI